MTTNRLTSGLLAALLVGVGVGASGCSKSDILQADTPDVIKPEDLNSPQGIAASFAGAVSDLVVSGTSGGGIVIWSGLFSDELKHSSTPPAVREWDLRDVLSTNTVATSATVGPFLLVQRARAALEVVGEALPANDARKGEAHALAGLAYIFLGENWCSGVPISNRETGETSPPISTSELFSRALEQLNIAGSNTGGDARITNLVAVLKGRALLNQGQFAQAATAVATVPSDYVYNFIHGNPPARQTNQVWLQNVSDIYSVSDQEGTNGLDFGSANDPRVPVSAPAVSRNDNVTQQQYFLKLTGQDSPIAMATGIEALMIRAEAALQAGDPTTWLGLLNQARATNASLTALADPVDAAARVDLMFRERAFWMYLTGHRLGDLRRLVRQYGRAKEATYPTGAYHKQGLTRGTQAGFIVPQPEENNPNYSPSDCTVDTP